MINFTYTPRGTYRDARNNAANVNAKVYTPQVKVEIYGNKGTFGTGSNFDPTYDLLALSTNKTFSTPTGTASLSFKAGVTGAGPSTTWLDLLHPMDFLVIRLSAGDGSPIRTVFAGYITNITETANVQDPQNPQRAVSVTAYDMMLGLTLPQLIAPSNVTRVPVNQQGQSMVTKWVPLFKGLVEANIGTGGTTTGNWLQLFLSHAADLTVGKEKLSPTQLLKYLIRYAVAALFNPNISVQMPNHTATYSYMELLSLAFCSMSDFAYNAFQTGPFDGSLYQIFQSYLNPPFFEFFGDIRSSDQLSDVALHIPYYVGPVIEGAGMPEYISGPDSAQYYVIVRKTPFSQDDWSQLTSYELQPEDLIGYTLSLSTQNVVNYYLCYSESINQLLPPGFTRQLPALGDADSILTYGYQPLVVPLYGLANADSIDQMTIEKVNTYTQELYSWYWKTPDMLSGTLTIRGEPSIRVGQRLSVPWWPMEAYVEGVQHNIVMFQSYTTQLTISRGTKAGTQYPPQVGTFTVQGSTIPSP